MQSNEAKQPAAAAASMPLEMAADLQDHLMSATNDLDRLQTLLSDACDTLQTGFIGASTHLQGLRGGSLADPAGIDVAVAHLGTAVTALQFQDLASQLIHHTRARLRNCADRLARDVFAGDEDGDAAIEPAPLRPSPVSQSEMDNGLIELF